MVIPGFGLRCRGRRLCFGKLRLCPGLPGTRGFLNDVACGKPALILRARRESRIRRRRRKRERTHIGKKHALVGAGEPHDGGVERQPFDSPHIIHQLADLLAIGLHSPVVNDLGPSAGLIDQRSQKLVHGNLMSGFFQDLALGGVARRFAVVELAFGKDPFVALA